MKSEKKLIKKYFGAARWAKILCIVSIVAFIGSLLIIGSGADFALVEKKDINNYTDFYGAHDNAGDKVFLNVSGIADEPCYTSGERNWFVVSDENLTDDRGDWYYYLICTNYKVYNTMYDQRQYFKGNSSEVIPYTLYGTSVVPSDKVRDSIMEFYEMTEEEYYGTFGRTVLQVNAPVSSVRTPIGVFCAITSILAFLVSIVQFAVDGARRSRTIKLLKQQGLLSEAAEELGNSIYTNDNPFLTDHYIFNRTAYTVSPYKDIWMVYAIGKKLYGVSRYNVVHPLADNNRNDVHDEIIRRIKAVNPQLLVGNTEANKMEFERMLRERMDDVIPEEPIVEETAEETKDTEI